MTSPPRARASVRTSSAARSAMTRRSTGERVNCCRLGEVQEIRHDLAKCLCLLTDSVDVRVIRRGQRVEIEEPRVPMNRRQAVAKLMSDARRSARPLAPGSLSTELLFHFNDVGQIGKQANGSVRLPVAIRERRYADAQIRRAIDRQSSLATVRRTIGSPLVQTLVDQLRKCGRQHVSIGRGERRCVAAQQTAACGIQNAETAIARDDEQTRRQALDDLAAEPLRGFGARRHLALLRFQLGQRFVQGGGDERGLGVVFA